MNNDASQSDCTGSLPTEPFYVNPSESIFRKLHNKENFSADDVWKVITAIEKKEASKAMIQTFTKNLKTMADERKFHTVSPKSDYAAPQKSGKNAYEIRTDVIKIAANWVSEWNKSQGQSLDENVVVAVAKKFYTFVENK